MFYFFIKWVQDDLWNIVERLLSRFIDVYESLKRNQKVTA